MEDVISLVLEHLDYIKAYDIHQFNLKKCLREWYHYRMMGLKIAVGHCYTSELDCYYGLKFLTKKYDGLDIVEYQGGRRYLVRPGDIVDVVDFGDINDYRNMYSRVINYSRILR